MTALQEVFRVRYSEPNLKRETRRNNTQLEWLLNKLELALKITKRKKRFSPTIMEFNSHCVRIYMSLNDTILANQNTTSPQRNQTLVQLFL